MTLTTPTEIPVSKSPPRRRRAAVRGRRGVLMVAAPLLLIVLAVLLLPVTGLLPDPNKQDLAAALQPPVFAGGTWDHPLGTDKLGHDLLSRLVHGGRLTLLIGLLGAIVAIVPGTMIGLLAGYRRGLTDTVLSRLIDAQLALPFILIALSVISSRGSSLGVLLMVLALTGWAPCARVVRSSAMALRERQFVMGLRAAGASESRIVLRHLLPNLAGTVVALATLQVGTAILVESALSFLGLGVVAPSISWGAILASGQSLLSQAWWVATLPGVAITVVVLLVNLLGDALLSHYDPRKGAHR
ncbi:ABC transporter permease [Actinocorallia aurantiaca]|jgi:peptide/nickel transport system permease protein|uniref:ABC transporter permease n=1 Tax=Actinocorallia aurantiaca TaxID=46204 RepID=A0ABP6H0Q3_9ACTN